MLLRQLPQNEIFLLSRKLIHIILYSSVVQWSVFDCFAFGSLVMVEMADKENEMEFICCHVLVR